jgi:hypothetical protein
MLEKIKNDRLLQITIIFLTIFFITYLLGLVILPISDKNRSVFIFPLAEEILKFSLLFPVYYLLNIYKQKREEIAVKGALNQLILFILVIFILAPIGDILNPTNTGSLTINMYIKQMLGHFAFTVIGISFIGFLYNPKTTKYYKALLMITSLFISILLHSIANQYGNHVAIGSFLESNNLSQNSYIMILTIISLILFGLFFYSRLKNKKVYQNPK